MAHILHICQSVNHQPSLDPVAIHFGYDHLVFKPSEVSYLPSSMSTLNFSSFILGLLEVMISYTLTSQGIHIVWHWLLLNMQNIKTNNTKELIYKQTLRFEEWIYSTREEGWGEGIVREFGIDMYTLLYLKWITNKDLLFSSRELCSMSCGNLDRKGTWGRMDTCICMAESLCCLPETITTLLISYTPV